MIYIIAIAVLMSHSILIKCAESKTQSNLVIAANPIHNPHQHQLTTLNTTSPRGKQRQHELTSLHATSSTDAPTLETILPAQQHNNSATSTHESPQETRIPMPLQLLAPSDLKSRINNIKAFLEKHPELSGELEAFKKHSPTDWKGQINLTFLRYAFQKHAELKAQAPLNAPTTRSDGDISAISTDPKIMFANLLNEVIEYSSTHDQEQKEKLKKQFVTGAAGIVILYFTTYLSNHFKVI